MTRLALILCVLIAGCSSSKKEDAEENESVPIGPGSDSTALIPPDTPMTSRQDTPQQRTAPEMISTTR
jgi:hypothetical protein